MKVSLGRFEGEVFRIFELPRPCKIKRIAPSIYFVVSPVSAKQHHYLCGADTDSVLLFCCLAGIVF